MDLDHDFEYPNSGMRPGFWAKLAGMLVLGAFIATMIVKALLALGLEDWMYG